MENPFAALLAESNENCEGISQKIIEDVFLFTLNKNVNAKDQALLCLADIVTDVPNETTLLSEELLAHALFERLLTTDTSNYLINKNELFRQEAIETKVILYLYRAFETCENIYLNADHSNSQNACKKIRNLILINSSTCMRQPELFQNQSLSTQWLQLFQRNQADKMIQEFLVQTVLKVNLDEEPAKSISSLKAIFYPMFNEVQKIIQPTNLITLPNSILWVLEYFVCDKRASELGEVLIDYTTPNPNAKGGEYMDTLFGQLLCISIMPKRTSGPFEFFNEISFESQHIDASLWQLMSNHQNSLFLLIKQLLVLSPTSKRKTLTWISNSLHANVARGHIWSNINLGADQTINNNASDSFMIGLCAILLRLCEPLCNPNMKVLLVDPTYCAVMASDQQRKQVSLHDAAKETCLLSTEENEIRITAEKYNFVTEIFYMTHKAYEIGYRACIERFNRMTRELHNLQTAYQDVQNSHPNNDDLAKNLLRMLREQMQQYLCIRNGLMEPKNDIFILKFFEATAVWLAEVTLISKEKFEFLLKKRDFAPHERKDIPLPSNIEFVPSYIKSIPENLIDNIIAYLSFSRHFPPGQYIEVYQSSHDAFFKMIILFMGSSELVKNPHLRAKLAEALEFFLPKKTSGQNRNMFFTKVFDNHVDRLNVVKSLLNVFVSIEMTGQSVQFEQKFNYRRPMYAIMEFLWSKEEQVNCFKALAIEAELNMEAIEPPIFLRFINLLINDAIFLLDESLSNLQQIRQLQESQAKGEWDNLTHSERQQHMTNLHHLGMLARFDNILGRDTINILKLISSEIKSIFCHNSMVDRIAAMLNYFLLNLVGPQKEKFKVKDKKEFEFDPAQTVLEICHIYINLSSSERFCLAISQDGRSYSSELFSYAEKILIRIGGGQLIGEMSEFAVKVQKLEAQYREEQDLIVDAPEDFLDPIMSTLMTDPVILPTSNMTVDRCTIARHLLSDQTDPFNRDPLTMDKVKPNEKLKTEIEKWIAEKRLSSQLKR